MLIDLRYHLISLVGVFLALAIGMLVGSSFIAGSSVKGLERQFVNLRAENRRQQQTIESLKEQLNTRVEFEKQAVPALVGRKLLGRRVAVIQTGDYSEATQRARLVLEAAGATVASVTTLSNLESQSAKERAARAVELIVGDPSERDPIGRVLQILANCVATGSGEESLEVLEDKGLLSRAGEYNLWVFHVVLIGGSKAKNAKRPQHADLVLIDKLRAAGVTMLVGAEPVDAAVSYIPAYHRKAISTVDNVDQEMGQVALVFALAGESGNFGVKGSADRVAPAYLSDDQRKELR